MFESQMETLAKEPMDWPASPLMGGAICKKLGEAMSSFIVLTGDPEMQTSAKFREQKKELSARVAIAHRGLKKKKLRDRWSEEDDLYNFNYTRLIFESKCEEMNAEASAEQAEQARSEAT